MLSNKGQIIVTKVFFSLAGSTFSGSMLSIDAEGDRSFEEDFSHGDIMQSRLFHQEGKPITPRPSDAVCMLDETRTMSGGRCYATPILEPPPPRHESDSDIESMSSEELSIKSDDFELHKGNIQEFKYLDNFVSVLCGTALKYAMAEVTNSDLSDVIKTSSVVRSIFPDPKYYHLTRNDVESMELVYSVNCENPPPQNRGSKFKEPEVSEVEIQREKLKEMMESDEDSLLDSDDDYDPERDKFFRKSAKKKKFYLVKKKGVEEFKKFLVGTLGEKNWNFWLDIERAKFIKDQTDLQK